MAFYSGLFQFAPKGVKPDPLNNKITFKSEGNFYYITNGHLTFSIEKIKESETLEHFKGRIKEAVKALKKPNYDGYGSVGAAYLNNQYLALNNQYFKTVQIIKSDDLLASDSITVGNGDIVSIKNGDSTTATWSIKSY